MQASCANLAPGRRRANLNTLCLHPHCNIVYSGYRHSGTGNIVYQYGFTQEVSTRVTSGQRRLSDLNQRYFELKVSWELRGSGWVSVKPGLWTGLTKIATYRQRTPPRLQQLVSSSASSCFLAVESLRQSLLDSERSKVTCIFNELQQR